MEILGQFQTSVKRALEEIDPHYEELKGLVICGTHAPDTFDIGQMIDSIQDVREYHIPYLGICFGHQLAAIEYARNVQGIKDATSEEFSEDGTFVVKKREDLNVGLRDGESYWNNYEVVIDWDKPDFFFTTQSHPEYQSTIDKPHPLLVNFLETCKHE